MIRQLLFTKLDYSAWANQRLLDACVTLTGEQLDRDLGVSHRSILGTLQHIYIAEQVWSERLRANPLPPLVERQAQVFEIEDRPLSHDPYSEPGLETLEKHWPKIWEASRQWLKDLPEEELDRETTCLSASGETVFVSRTKILLHMVNHSTLHRGQVMNMLRSLGKQPPGTDLFSFYLL
jgi:uncharacterized damage-inducible protein DinB